MYFLTIHCTEIAVSGQIPELPYPLFHEQVVKLLQSPVNRLVSYYGFKDQGQLRLMGAIMNRSEQCILVGSCALLPEPGIRLASIGWHHRAAREFEQKITRSFGITFTGPVASLEPPPLNTLS